MITKKELKDYASKLMFDMSEEEYVTLEKEFAFFLKQMEKIEKMNIQNIEPMIFPFDNQNAALREDVVGEYLTVDEVLANSKHHLKDQIKVPKVVE